MARALKDRVAHMEARRGVNQGHDPSLRLCFQVAMNARKGIELVRPEDTDRATYAEIEKTRAGARGDWAVFDRLEAEFPCRYPPCPPEQAARPLGEAAWLTRVICKEQPKRRAAVQRAIEAARKRIEREALPRKTGGRA